MRIVGQNSDVHFGEVDEEEPDWRNELEEETDPDDDELEYTPQDVIDILGFDPKEFSEPEPTDNESNPMSLNVIKAQMIINAKSVSKKGLGKTKGWTDEARAKAAMTRKAKKKVVGGKSGETAPKKIVKKGMTEAASKQMDKTRAKSQVDRSKVQAMDENQLQGLLASKGRNPLKMYAQHEMKKRGIAVSKRR